MKPLISVIIPLAPNRPCEAIPSIEAQGVPIEIIVERGKNPSQNRNKGIARAKADIIAFIDAHSLLPENWAKHVLALFDSNPQIDAIGGPQLTAPRESRFGVISGYALSSTFGSAGSSTRYSPRHPIQDADERYLTSANLVCRRKVIERVRFDETLWPGEDPKFIADAKKAGLSLLYHPNIFVYHTRRATVGDFARQIFNYGYTRPKKEALTETLFHPSFLVPPAFTIYLALFTILSFIQPMFIIPLALYVVLLVFFSLYEGAIKNSDPISVFYLPFIFFTIHITYGLGFIAGTVKQWLKKDL